MTGERESCWGSVRSSPGSTSSTTRKEGLHAARIWGKSEKEQIVGKLGGFKTSVDLHVSEFLVPDVWGGSPTTTLSATTRSPDSSTGLSGKLKVFNEKTEEGIEQLVAVIATITPDD